MGRARKTPVLVKRKRRVRRDSDVIRVGRDNVQVYIDPFICSGEEMAALIEKYEEEEKNRYSTASSSQPETDNQNPSLDNDGGK